jgi:hypothetical protein
LTLANLSIDLVDNGRLEDSLEEHRTIFLSAKSGAGCHYILIISAGGTKSPYSFNNRNKILYDKDYQLMAKNILNFLCHTIAAYAEKVQPMIQNFKISL